MDEIVTEDEAKAILIEAYQKVKNFPWWKKLFKQKQFIEALQDLIDADRLISSFITHGNEKTRQNLLGVWREADDLLLYYLKTYRNKVK